MVPDNSKMFFLVVKEAISFPQMQIQGFLNSQTKCRKLKILRIKNCAQVTVLARP